MRTYGICIESSHEKGMGHLFRALNLIRFLRGEGNRCIVFVNSNFNSELALQKARIKYDTVSLYDYRSDWESIQIKKHKINVWVDDRLDTKAKHASFVKKNNIPLVTFDDRGDGAELSDINIGALPFNFHYRLKGRRVLKGLDYLVLNKDIDYYKRVRRTVKNILITLGGSDTHFVTAKVVKILKGFGLRATVVVGPCFKRIAELRKVCGSAYPIVRNIGKSQIREFYKYDLAISAAGITPFEANASGLPCIMIANEMHEIKNALFLEKLGCSVFAGHYKQINKDIFKKRLNIERMSKLGLRHISTKAVDRIYRYLKLL